MDELTSGTYKGLSLAQLTEWVWGQECGWGPIIGIGHTNEGTAATFRFSENDPVTKADIRPLLDGQAARDDAVVGYVFILNEIMKVQVYR